MTAPPTDADIERLLRSAPSDRWPELWAAADAVHAGGEHATWTVGEDAGSIVVDGVTQPLLQMPYVRYSDAVNRMLGCLGAIGAVVPFNWRQWDGADRLQGASALDSASVADAVRMVTTIIRGERFGEGTIAAMLDDGTLLAAVRRLRRWHEEERRAP